MERALKKYFIFIFVGILILLISYFLLILTLPISKSKYTSSSSRILTKVPSCPQNYCSDWILGSCIGKNERYKERECYDYPDKGTDCESGKKIYYEKGSQFDAAC